MLRTLRISNLVLINEAELDFDAGLNAITGETGAGKTILANAFGLLLGAKGDAAPDRRRRRTEAYVEAEFDGVDDERSGRSPTCGPTGRRGSCSPAGSSRTGGRAPTRGAGAPPARTWPRPPRR